MMNLPADIILYGIFLFIGLIVLAVVVFSKNEKTSEFFEKVLDFIEDMLKGA